MDETIVCRDGRVAILHFGDDSFIVTASDGQGRQVGSFEFVFTDRADRDEEEDSGDDIAVHLVGERLEPDWAGQGIRERVLILMDAETFGTA